MLFKLLQKKLFVTSTCHYLLYYFSGRPVLTNLLSINRPTKLLSKLKHQWSLYFATFGLNHTNIGSERLFGHCTKKRRKQGEHKRLLSFVEQPLFSTDMCQGSGVACYREGYQSSRKKGKLLKKQCYQWLKGKARYAGPYFCSCGGLRTLLRL